MKKIILCLLVGIIALSVVACTTENAEEALKVTGTLEEIMPKLYADLTEEMPNTVITTVAEEMNAYFLGAADIEYVEAIASEPMMSSIAHSVVLLRTVEGADIEAVKEKIRTNVDGRKWICVGVEDDEIIIDSIGDLVVLIMDKNADTIHQSFLNLAE